MSTTSSFFSFGSDDSFVSKSFEGFKYQNAPLAFQELVHGGSVAEVSWAAFGPLKESWVLSYRDPSMKDKFAWGISIPTRLRNILSKTTPSRHLRVCLGPLAPLSIPVDYRCDSFVAWDPTFVRWGGLPSKLEDSLQSWLTPSGWKSGPPRIVTWGPQEAFFAMSEYGDVVYRLGSRTQTGEAWPIFKETVEEWKAEAEFHWSDLAYVSLDATTPDQFIAIRLDGTWAGSIDDTNEEALESFAHNFFARLKPKSKPKPRPSPDNNQHSNGISKTPVTAPSLVIHLEYKQWASETASLFASALAANGGGSRPRAPKKLQVRSQSSSSSPSPSVPTTRTGSVTGKLLSQFPYLPPAVTTCSLPVCHSTKSDSEGLRACKHDVELLLRASGQYSYEWLRQERIRWHPDRFGRLCEESFRESGTKLAEEMFKIIDGLLGSFERLGSVNEGS
ncbi:hypothetical protein BDV95DRAFT_559558 [Massariosphaeria phaeospora]|uniref:Uncharacterized protein n=1 Tax=Massariosphaeria phaeospora TaxID=100035 RepID=A0A7C8MD83_9PLEO|nr:hypothetical protein BDV95DRAFT_559558 [Massariosphaeria phaeospora]